MKQCVCALDLQIEGATTVSASIRWTCLGGDRFEGPCRDLHPGPAKSSEAALVTCVKRLAAKFMWWAESFQLLKMSRDNIAHIKCVMCRHACGNERTRHHFFFYAILRCVIFCLQSHHHPPFSKVCKCTTTIVSRPATFRWSADPYPFIEAYKNYLQVDIVVADQDDLRL